MDTSIPQMSLQELRVKVALLCGWRSVEKRDGFDCPTQYGVLKGKIGGPFAMWHTVPDYPNDLNACHEAGRVMTDDQRWRQIQIITRCEQGPFPVLSRSEALRLATVSAEQWCRAFVAVMENLHRSENGGVQATSLLTKTKDSE